jgi:predicted ATPase
MSNGEKNQVNAVMDQLINMNLVERGRDNWLEFSHDRIQQAAEQRVRDKTKLRLYCVVTSVVRIQARKTRMTGCSSHR